MAKEKTRGIRNNNPGNIEYQKGTKWQGLATPPVEQAGRFARFESPVYGIRAIARTVITYFDKYGYNTVGLVIARWAPPGENNTGAYQIAVANKVGVGIHTAIDLHDPQFLRPLVCAIIEHENGLKSYKDVYADDVIDKALVLAGVEPPKKPLTKTSAYQGAAVTTAGVTLSAVVDIAKDSATQVQPLIEYSDTLRWVFIALTLLGIGITIYGRLRQRQKGIA